MTDEIRNEPVANEAAAAPVADAAETPERDRNNPAKRSRARIVRWGILGAILAFVTANGYLHQHPIAGLRTVGVDALCPFGGLESLWALLTAGSMLQHIAISTFVLFGFTVLLAVIFRRTFCGYICPLGFLQELFGKIGGKIWGRKRPQVPAAIDRPARYLKYVVLAVIAVWTWTAGTLVIRAFDPWVAYMHLSTAEVLTEFWLGIAVLAVSLIGSIFYDRFFCKYLCPMGALLAMFSRIAPFAVRRNASTCTSCKACDRACPVNIKVSEETKVTDGECINCNECVNACPVSNTLVFGAKIGEKRTVLSPGRTTGIVIGSLAVVLALTTAAGVFAWTMPSAPTASAATGKLDPETIKGYMTFEQIAAAAGISPMVLEQRFGIAASDMTVPIKDISEKYGFDVHTDVRDFVVEQAAAAAASTEGTASGSGD